MLKCLLNWLFWNIWHLNNSFKVYQKISLDMIFSYHVFLFLWRNDKKSNYNNWNIEFWKAKVVSHRSYLDSFSDKEAITLAA